MHNYNLRQQIKHILLVITMSAPLMACAGQKHKSDVTISTISDISITIGKSGIPVIRTKNGEKLLTVQRLEKGSSIRATSIEEIRTITMVRAKGSHYIIISIGGVDYKVNLPH